MKVMVLLFEVIKSGKVMMYTQDEVCIPSPELLQEMAAMGYTFRKDKKTWNPPTKRRQQKRKVANVEEK